MDVASTPQGFGQLPLEIMSLIAEDMVGQVPPLWESRKTLDDLKNLRLACRCWSYVPGLLSLLFESIPLKATPKNLDILDEFDFSGIAPYVSGVTFIPPLQNWTLDFDDFRNVVSPYLKSTNHRMRALHPHDYSQDPSDGSFSKDNRDGRFPVSAEQIHLAFEEYHRCAQANLDLLQGQRLRQVWIQTLKSFRRCRTVRFRDSTWTESDALNGSSKSSCIAWPYDHWDLTRAYTYWHNVMGSELFQTAVYCLAEAKTSIQRLSIKCHVLSTYSTWEDLSRWAQLDFSQLQEFSFEPQDQLHKVSTHHEMNVGLFLNGPLAVMRKGHASLRIISCRTTTSVRFEPSWPGSEIIPLPKLRYLRMRSVRVDEREMAHWIEQMSKLDHLRLEHVRQSASSNYLDWRHVFDALRDHPNDIHVELLNLYTNMNCDMYLSYRKSEIDKYLRSRASRPSRRPFSLNQATAQYISGCGSWQAVEDLYHCARTDASSDEGYDYDESE